MKFSVILLDHFQYRYRCWIGSIYLPFCNCIYILNVFFGKSIFSAYIFCKSMRDRYKAVTSIDTEMDCFLLQAIFLQNGQQMSTSFTIQSLYYLYANITIIWDLHPKLMIKRLLLKLLCTNTMFFLLNDCLLNINMAGKNWVFFYSRKRCDLPSLNAILFSII